MNIGRTFLTGCSILAALSFCGRVNAAPVVSPTAASVSSGTLSPTPLDTIIVEIEEPGIQYITGDSLHVRVSVQSTYEIIEVRASVESVDTLLQPSLNGYTGYLVLTGLVRGPKELIVTVEDFFHATLAESLEIRYDRAPVLTVSAPGESEVARPVVHIKASCTDDDPLGCILRVRASPFSEFCDGDSVAAGLDSVDTDLDLSVYTGRIVTLCFSSYDSVGQRTDASRTVYVDSSKNLHEVMSVHGSLLDVDSGRLLVTRRNKVTGDKLFIIDRGSLSEEEVPLPGPREIGERNALLTPNGVIVSSPPLGGSSTDYRLFTWDGDTLIDHGLPNSTYSFGVAGDYAIWNEGSDLIRWNTRDGSETLVSSDAGNIENDVTEDGTVAFWSNDYQVHLYRNDSMIDLTADAAWNIYPLTDGNVTVYKKLFGSEFAIAMHDGAETILTEYQPRDVSVGWDYRVTGGWVAFMRPGNLFQKHVWLRSPDGQEIQLTIFGTDSRVDNLDPYGEVLIINGEARYRADTAGFLSPVGTSLGFSRSIGGRWFLGMGNTLFVLDSLATGVEEGPVPAKFSLAQNYPNPFNSVTRIPYGLENAGHVTLVIFDILGRRVGTVFSGRRPAGRYEAEWNPGSNPSGVYYAVLTAGEMRAMVKLLLMK